jgi:ornithine cyclodeaminase
MQFAREDVASRVVSMAKAIEVIEKMFREYGRDESGRVGAHNGTSIGAVLNGAPGRTSPQQITVYDSSGMALQDMAICSLALAKAS